MAVAIDFNSQIHILQNFPEQSESGNIYPKNVDKINNTAKEETI